MDKSAELVSTQTGIKLSCDLLGDSHCPNREGCPVWLKVGVANKQGD